MILVDTSVWIDHFRHKNSTLKDLLNDGAVLTHPFVIGELALGNLEPRNEIMRGLKTLPRATIATDDEVLDLISAQALSGTGIGYIDAHLLAATRITPHTTLWTLDKRLAAVVERQAFRKTLN